MIHCGLVASGELGRHIQALEQPARGDESMIASARKLQTEALPIPRDKLSAILIERLSAAGINTCDAWLALGCRRHRIFGVTRRIVAQIDTAVAEAMRT